MIERYLKDNYCWMCLTTLNRNEGEVCLKWMLDNPIEAIKTSIYAKEAKKMLETSSIQEILRAIPEVEQQGW